MCQEDLSKVMRMRYRHIKKSLALLGTGALSLLLASCGGSDTNSTSVAKAQFVRQANAICQMRLTEKDRLVEEGLQRLAAQNQGEERLSPAQVEELSAAVLPTYRDLVQELNDLPEPAQGQEDADKIMEQFEAGLQALEEDPQALIGKNPFLAGVNSAHSFGLKACNP